AADGRAFLRLVLPEHGFLDPASGDLQVDLAASRQGCETVGRAVTLHAGETTHLGDVVLGAGVRIVGRAVDGTGAAVARATIGIARAEVSDDAGHTRRHGSPAFSRVPSTVSSTDGAFTIDGVAHGTLRVWAHAEGTRYSW